MRIMTIAGTRPELIRLSQIIPKLDKACEHIFVFTGQSFSNNMSQVFFDEMPIRKPDDTMEVGVENRTLTEQIGQLFKQTERCIRQYEPDGLLVLGDTNSALSAFIAKRMRVKVYHMEAGNRCYNDISPEEINRRAIDAWSDILMPYTNRSRDNLLLEGYPEDRIIVTGNPIYEVLQKHYPSDALRRMRIEAGKYFLATLHRYENIEEDSRLVNMLSGLRRIVGEYGLPIVFSCHPRTRQRIKETISISDNHIIYSEPMGFNDFVTLEKQAKCVLTDSGTVQEECCILHIPCVTLRDFTERPETVDCGSNILSGADPENILNCVNVVLSKKPEWEPPEEYLWSDVSDTVVRVITERLSSSPAEILVKQPDDKRKDEEGQHSGYRI